MITMARVPALALLLPPFACTPDPLEVVADTEATGSATDPAGPGSTMNTESSGLMSHSGTGPPPTTSTTGSTAGGTTSDDTGGTTSDDTGGTTSDGDTGAALDGCYDPANYPYGGALCGPPGMPCTVLRDEVIDPEPHSRNGEPAIALDDACQPQILYSVALLGFHGHFSRRVGVAAWDDQDTPFPFATGGLAYDAATGETLAVPDDGAFGVSVWRFSGGAWAQEDILPGLNIALGRAVAHRGDGILHAGVLTELNEFRYAQWDAGWASSSLDYLALEASSAVGSDEVPHFAYWSFIDGPWHMFWIRPGHPREMVTEIGADLVAVHNSIAVTPDGGDGTPHLSFAFTSPPGSPHRIAYATRNAPNDWSVLTVASEGPAVIDTCSQRPQGPGEQCEIDDTLLRPLDIVASEGGDVRIFYTEYHIMRTRESSCSPGPGGLYCSWTTVSDNSTGTLHVAWPDAGSIASAPVLLDRTVRSMTSAIDIAGRIHVAAYTDFSQSRVEYLLIGP